MNGRAGMQHLSLIQALVLLDGQKGSKRKRNYKNSDIQPFEINSENVDLACKLAHDILRGPFLNLSPLSCLLLLLILEMANKACAAQKMNRRDLFFSLEDVKKQSGWRCAQVKQHLQQLKQKRYIRQKGKGYQLLYSGEGRKVERFLLMPPDFVDTLLFLKENPF
jgi:hypothetical protein